MPRFNAITFFSELRRRRVVQVALIYAAAAGGVISACDWIFPQLPGPAANPDRALRWVIIAAAACFPVALVFGWLYDVSTEGIRRTPSFAATARDHDPSLRRIDHWTIGGLTAAVLAIVAVAVVRILHVEPLPQPATASAQPPIELDPMALAVLPLVDRSAADEDAELLAFGVHDTLLSLLSKISAVRVISRTTMEQYKGTAKTLPEIAQELGVANLMEGSVQRVGNQVRISVQLIRAPSDAHLWAEIYDIELTATNLFEIQSDIARAVATKLTATLSPEDQRALAGVPTTNTEALAAYMLGRERLRNRNSAELAQAVQQFARAIELDPGYAAAYSGLVDACKLYVVYSGGHLLEGCPANFDEAESLLRKALALDDTLGEAWISLADLLAAPRLNRAAEAHAAFERGLRLSPSYSYGYHAYALRLNPHFELAKHTDRKRIDVALQGLSVDPLSVPLHYLVSGIYERDKQFDNAFEHARRIVEIAPDSPKGHERLAELEGAVRGRFDELIRGEARAAKLDPGHPDFWRIAGNAYVNLGDFDMALRYYERAASLVPPEEAVYTRAMMAVPLLLSGRRREARQLLERAAIPGESSWPAVHILTDLDISEHRTREALDRLKKSYVGCFEGDELIADCSALLAPQTARLWQAADQPQRAQRLAQREWERTRLEMGTLPWRASYFGNGRSIIHDVRVLAPLGRRDEALTALEEAIALGWRARQSWPTNNSWAYAMKFDATLDSIRGDPRFEAAFSKIAADMAIQLKAVREMERTGEIPAREELAEPRFDQ